MEERASFKYKKKKKSKPDTPTLSRYILALKGNKMAFKMQCNDEFYLFFPTLDADREKEKKMVAGGYMETD